MKRALLLLVVVYTSIIPDTFAGNEATKWNQILLNAVRAEASNPVMAARAMAMVHLSMFDAINAIEQKYEPYALKKTSPPSTIEAVAGAVAAHRVLAYLFPAQRDKFDAYLGETLKMFPNGLKKVAAIAIGESAATAILDLRRNDIPAPSFMERVLPLDLNSDWGRWFPTPPAYASPLLPNWGFVKPFAMTSGSQFRQAGPPLANTTEYTMALEEVRLLGGKDSTVRSPDEAQAALFWADGPGTCTPGGHYNMMANVLIDQRGIGLMESARLFALLNAALADAGIAAWDMKYHFWFWRPVTALRRHGQNATWEPLVVTPPFPEYVSGHSTFSGAAYSVLSGFFKTDDMEFSLTSDALPGITRQFERLSEAAAEAGRSRILGGIHFEFSNQDGLKAGQLIGNYVFANFMRPKSAFVPDISGPVTVSE